MAVLTLNGVSVKTPTKMSVTTSDFDGETTRNAKGNLIRDRIGVKKKVECEWSYLTQSEISKILNAVSKVFFSVKYLDPALGMTTKTMYVGDRTAPLYRYGNGGGHILWEGLTMNFIEQ